MITRLQVLPLQRLFHRTEALHTLPQYKMSSNMVREQIAEGNTAGPGEAPRQTIQRADGAEVELVTFEPGDPENPRNWPLWRKWSIVVAIAFIDLTVSFAASGFSPASAKFAKDFGVSSEVATLGLSMCVLGFAIGPMTLAPLSEVGSQHERQ